MFFKYIDFNFTMQSYSIFDMFSITENNNVDVIKIMNEMYLFNNYLLQSGWGALGPVKVKNPCFMSVTLADTLFCSVQFLIHEHINVQGRHEY